MNQSLRVLHVDDDPVITAMVGEMLQEQGIEVTSLNDPTLAMAELVQQNYRVVILDQEMPHVSGTDLLQQIKAYDGGIQVIMLTGVDNMTNVLRMMRKGALSCCFKPLKDPAELLDALQQAFNLIRRWWRTLEESRVRARQVTDSSVRQSCAMLA